jgi:hypothetical protein
MVRVKVAYRHLSGSALSITSKSRSAVTAGRKGRPFERRGLGPMLDALHQYFTETVRTLSKKSQLAGAIRYTLLCSEPRHLLNASQGYLRSGRQLA